MIIVVKEYQLAELKMTGERCGCICNTFHEIAIGTNSERVMIDDFIARLVEHRGEILFGNGHSHASCETFAKGSGGHFHAGSKNVFRMPGSFTSPLPEVLEIFERKIVAGKK